MSEDSIPDVGEVIRHAYLWYTEARRGQNEGSKDRPCVVIHRVSHENNDTTLYVLPITHTAPVETHHAVELPIRTKQRLQLDALPSWIITTELNYFVWPGFDVRKTQDGRPSFGYLPNKLTINLIEQIKRNAKDKSLASVDRNH